MSRLALGLVLLLTPVFLLAQTPYSHGDPTPDEQYMLELINRARATPAEEGIRLMDTQDSRVQAAYQFFNINKEATKAAFTTYPSRPPLAFHPDLMTAARDHTADMVAKNFQGHFGSDGSTLQQRYQRVGYQSMGMYGENVSAYSESVWYGHCGLNVDWGEQNQKDLGHRRNLMNFDTQVYTEIGIGITRTSGGLQTGTVGPFVITQDFGVRNVKYITGVVYEDKNNNDFYDVGEGMAGVRIDASNGQYYAITSTSGGYAIPYSGSGQVTVTASGGGLSVPIPVAILIGSESVKLDFSPSAEPPGVATLKVPANGTLDLPTFRILFDWDPISFATQYEFQLSTSPQFTTLVHTSTESTTGEEYTVDACDRTYYWRVRGVNDVAPGPWSAVWTFKVSGRRLDPPTLLSPLNQTTVDQNGSVAFSWAPVPNATLYTLKLARANFQPLLDTVVAGTSVDIPLSRIGAASSFRWTVSTKDICQWGMDGTSQLVDLTVTSVDEGAPAIALSVAPHPATSLSTIQFQTDVSGTYRLGLIDAAGSEIVTRIISLDAGSQSVAGLFSGVAAGAYVVVIEGPQAIRRFSVIVWD